MKFGGAGCVTPVRKCTSIISTVIHPTDGMNELPDIFEKRLVFNRTDTLSLNVDILDRPVPNNIVLPWLNIIIRQ